MEGGTNITILNALKKIFGLFSQNKNRLYKAAVLASVLGFLPLKAHAATDDSWIIEGLAGVWNWIGTSATGLLNITIEGIYFGFASIIFALSVTISAFAGYTADFFINYALQPNFYNLDGITLGWAISRDVANLFFIFILLAIAIATILRYESYGAKTLLPKLLLVALLINFSLPVSRAIIDVSNMLALKFYNGIALEGKTPVSTAINKIGKMSGVLNKDFLEKKQLEAKQEDQSTSYAEIGTILLSGSAVLLTLAFVMAAFAVLFLIRIVTLAFVLILAPLGFLAMVLPGTKGYASEWWDKLFQQSFFAPFSLMMLYISITLLDNLQKLAEDSTTPDLLDPSAASFTAAVTGTGQLDIIFNFALVIGLLIGSLLVAKKLGATGASTAINWGQAAYKGARGYAGKQTYGRAATAIDKRYGEQMRAISPTLGTLLSGGLKGLGAGYAKSVEARVQGVTSIKNPELQAKALANLSEAERKTAWGKLNAQQKADVRSSKAGKTEYKGIINALEAEGAGKEKKAAAARIEAAISGAQKKQEMAKGFDQWKFAALEEELSKGSGADTKKVSKLVGELAIFGKNLKEIGETLSFAGNKQSAEIAKTLNSSPSKIAINAILQSQKPPQKEGGGTSGTVSPKP